VSPEQAILNALSVLWPGGVPARYTAKYALLGVYTLIVIYDPITHCNISTWTGMGRWNGRWDYAEAHNTARRLTTAQAVEKLSQ